MKSINPKNFQSKNEVTSSVKGKSYLRAMGMQMQMQNAPEKATYTVKRQIVAFTMQVELAEIQNAVMADIDKNTEFLKRGPKKEAFQDLLDQVKDRLVAKHFGASESFKMTEEQINEAYGKIKSDLTTLANGSHAERRRLFDDLGIDVTKQALFKKVDVDESFLESLDEQSAFRDSQLGMLRGVDFSDSIALLLKQSAKDVPIASVPTTKKDAQDKPTNVVDKTASNVSPKPENTVSVGNAGAPAAKAEVARVKMSNGQTQVLYNDGTSTTEGEAKKSGGGIMEIIMNILKPILQIFGLGGDDKDKKDDKPVEQQQTPPATPPADVKPKEPVVTPPRETPAVGSKGQPAVVSGR